MVRHIQNSYRLEIIRIVSVYAIFGALWIYLSDTALAWMFHDPEIITRISVYKGLMFILLTAALLYFLISRYIRRISGYISERDLAQQELARQKTLLDSVIEGTSDAVYIKDTEGRYLLANSAVSRFVGRPVAEIIGRDDTHLFSPDDARAIMEQDRWVMGQNTPQTYEEHLTTQAGERYFLSTKGAVRDGTETVVALFGIARDITERKQAEQQRLNLERQLLQTQKLESLGVLAGGVAHDFNNLLTAILGNLDLTLLRLPDSSPVRHNIEQSMQACSRAAYLTRQMLAYAGKGVFQLKPVDLGEIVRNNIDLFKTVIPSNVNLTVAVEGTLPLIMADPGQMQQTVLNLITNASESFGTEPGNVSVTTGVTECSAECIAQSCLAEKPSPGAYVFLEVADNGCGMDEATKKRLFEPFFSTKFTGRGLGMAATQGIVRSHNGILLLESGEGTGTTIRILFPTPAQTRETDVVPLREASEEAELLL